MRRHPTSADTHTHLLDYSSEMLALTNKVATPRAEGLADPVVLAAVDDIEDLTSTPSARAQRRM